MLGMADDVQPAAPATNVPQWDADFIFVALSDPVRRGLLLTLAHGGAFPASHLKNGAGRRLDATLKHLVSMRKAGLLVMQPDPADGRRMLYSLSSSVPVTMTESGAVIDFGFLLLRL
jgi:hypothetical protein